MGVCASLTAAEVQDSQGNPFFRPGARPLVLGHRGVPQRHQENTLAAFQEAIDKGIDGVELDIYVTKDNHVVCFHDEDTMRLCGVEGAIQDMTYEEVKKLQILQEYDATGSGEMKAFPSAQPIPLLEDVINHCRGKLFLNIEMKAYTIRWDRRHWGTEVAKVIRRCDARDFVVVTSFDWFMLRALEAEYPGIHSGFAYDPCMSKGLTEAADSWFADKHGGAEIRSNKLTIEKGDDLAQGKGFMRWVMESQIVSRVVASSVVDLSWRLIDRDTVTKFHNRGHAVGVYCLYPFDTRQTSEEEVSLTDEQTEALVKKLVEMDVDWIETDDPERLHKQLDQICGCRPQPTSTVAPL